MAFSNTHPDTHCDSPHWAAPAESDHGTFRGDLFMDCWVTPAKTNEDLLLLKSGIIDKIQAESTIHEGPISSSVGKLPSLKWDVSHLILENGNSIIIREEANLTTDSKDQLTYKTHSKNVSASGMAGYLRSVNFSMNVERTPSNKPIHIEFRNEVTVDRPWYALDLIFAPIARNVCFDKMEQLKEKLLPWVAAHL
jgi:hypothetical protein